MPEDCYQLPSKFFSWFIKKIHKFDENFQFNNKISIETSSKISKIKLKIRMPTRITQFLKNSAEIYNKAEMSTEALGKSGEER
jgi:hypothetical protein